MPNAFAGTGGVTDDLAGLFGPSNPAISTASASNSTSSYPKASNADILGMFNQPSIAAATSMAQPRPMGFNPLMQTQAQIGVTPVQGYQPQAGVGILGQGPIMLPGTPQQQMKGLGLGGSGSGSGRGTPSLGGQISPPRGTSTSANASTSTSMGAGVTAGGTVQKDPFADLAGLF
jgi:hypothetical protein